MCNIPAVMGSVQSLQEASIEHKLSQICRKFTILSAAKTLCPGSSVLYARERSPLRLKKTLEVSAANVKPPWCRLCDGGSADGAYRAKEVSDVGVHE